MPVATGMYYNAAHMIDLHNRIRSKCAIDSRFWTRNWSVRVNFGILSMLFTDAYLLYKACRGSKADLSPRLFFSLLSDRLIDLRVENSEGKLTRGTNKRTYNTFMADKAFRMESRTSHTQPGTSFAKQGRCTTCKAWTTHICLDCTVTKQGKQQWMCKSKDSLNCWKKHIDEIHK